MDTNITRPGSRNCAGHIRTFWLAVSALSLAGCAVTEPVAVVSKGVPGGIMRGTTTAAISGGSFNVSNGTLSCGGTYDALDYSPTITAHHCHSRQQRRERGGHFTLSDGTTGDFLFGEAAQKL